MGRFDPSAGVNAGQDDPCSAVMPPNMTCSLLRGGHFGDFLCKILACVFKMLNNAEASRSIPPATSGPLFAIKAR